MEKQGIDRFILSVAGWGLLLGLTACGQVTSSGRMESHESTGIIGGETVLETDPIAASTVAILNKKVGQIVCTASLVSENLILTAAHCTTENPQDLAIVFTRKLPKTRQDLAKMEVRPVIAGQTHESWPLNNFETDQDWGDIALLRFEGSLPSSFKVARLLEKADHLKSGTQTVIAGFGWTSGRKRTSAEGLNKTSVKIENPSFSKTEILLNQSQGRGACHGDSGGPAFVEFQGELMLVGVTSRGHDDPNDTCEHYSIYSSVLAHADWMKTTALALQDPGAIGRKMPQPF